MKSCLSYTMLVVLLCLPEAAGADERLYLSGQDAATAVPWEFHMSTGRNRGYWTTIPVPSNWELHGFGYYTYGDDYEGYQANPEIGLYRRRFQMQDIVGKRYRLTFQGAMTDTRVTLNGQSAGDVHQGGFMQFSYDITRLVKEGENLLEVEVRKSSENPVIQQSERHADFWLFGGIFRPVYIDVLPSEFVERVAIDARMDGRFAIDVYLNGIAQADRITVRVFDAGGRPAGPLVEAAVSPGHPVVRVERRFDGVEQWSHEFPHRYRAEITLLDGGRLIHQYRQPFGFRTFEVRDYDGFYLNGRRILLKGANMHSIRPETGRALSHEDMRENFQLLKDLNFNAVRPCHYPPDEYFFTLCDSLGMLAFDELTGWHSPLDKQNGSRLVQELIARDVNHPCIVMWSNGNHMSHNPELDEDFFRWDIQQRRPLRNAARVEEIFSNYAPAFDIVNTTMYPSWAQLNERLNDTHILMPVETLHALYDGGGAAGLAEYWAALKKSRVGGGLFIWALYDEGVVRTDQGNRIDCQGNKAADGLVGPHGEKEGSYYAVREIWSPMQIAMDSLPPDFDGTIPVSNEFTFVNLNQCRFEWRLLDFTNLNEAPAGHRILANGAVEATDIPAGSAGNIQARLPRNWRDAGALELQAFDHTGYPVSTWRWPVANREQLTRGVVTGTQTAITRDPTDRFLFHAAGNHYRFDPRTGALVEVIAGDRKLPVGPTPYIVAGPVDSTVRIAPMRGRVTVETSGGNIRIVSSGSLAFDEFSWTIAQDGSLTLDYQFTLPKGKYHYSGIGMALPAEQVTGKRWLGEGPSRIWKNRTEGGLLDVWDMEKKINIPGAVWNLPEFEGCFAPWYWAAIRLKGDHQIAFSTMDKHLILGVLNPVNGEDPKFAAWHYPEKEGLYLFHCISGVGEKWKPAEDLGPQGQPTEIQGPCKGKVNLMFDWNRMDTATKKFKVEIQ